MISRLVFLQAVVLCALDLSSAVSPDKTFRGATLDEETADGKAERSLRMGMYYD